MLGLTVEVDVDGVETDEEVGERVLLGWRDMSEQSADQDVASGELEARSEGC